MEQGRRVVRFVAGLVLASCLVTSLMAPAGAATGPGSSSSLSRALQRLVTMSGGPPGAIALVQVGSKVTVTTAGVGNTVTGAPISPDDTVRIASISKAFNGAVALALVTQGKLHLRDTIAQRLPRSARVMGQDHPG